MTTKKLETINIVSHCETKRNQKIYMVGSYLVFRDGNLVGVDFVSGMSKDGKIFKLFKYSCLTMMWRYIQLGEWTDEETIRKSILAIEETIATAVDRCKSYNYIFDENTDRIRFEEIE